MCQTKTHATKHTCGGPSFGRLTVGCPRCDELAAGAAPREWNRSQYDGRMTPAAFSAALDASIAREKTTGVPSTFGQW